MESIIVSFPENILLINGPNLSRLGKRKPEIYGHTSLAEVVSDLNTLAEEKGYCLVDYQSHSEGNIIDVIESNYQSAGIVINPGALMIAGWSLRDALEAFPGRIYEVHISNIWARESFRHQSILSAQVDGVICGCGVLGYRLALIALIAQLSNE